MKFTADENGIFVKQLFKKVSIPYADIKSIVMKTPQTTFITTEDGKEYIDEDLVGLPYRCPEVMDKIPLYNIDYKYDGMLEDNRIGIFGEKEMQSLVSSQVADLKEKAVRLVKDILGEAYDLEFIVRPAHMDAMLYIKLYKDGALINAHNNIFDDPEEGMTEIFSSTILSYLYEWDSTTKKGQFVVLNETQEILEEIEMHCARGGKLK